MKAHNTPAVSDRTSLPLSALFLDPRNARTQTPTSIESMAASIKACGVIQNLVVVESREAPGTYGVVAGGRRWRGLSLLLERGDINGGFMVPVAISNDEQATMLSLQENTQREEMHPADEYEAFSKLHKQKMTIDRIADAFGVTPLVVERRLSLAKAAPELLDLYRKDEIRTEQLIALCATDDHERQLDAWNSAPSWNRSASALRHLVVGGEIDATKDKRVAFIGGVLAYEAAGGKVRRDLFADGDSGFLSDSALLEKLVAAKLESTAEQLQAEGWAWVEIIPDFNYTAFDRLGRIFPENGTLTDDQVARIGALNDEAKALQDEEATIEAKPGDYSDEDSDRLEVIYDRLQEIPDEVQAIERENAAFSEAAKQHAGAWVAYDNGKLRIERGLVKAEDRKALAKAGGAAEGGRETKPAGRKDNALSDPMRRSLLARRNFAAQLALAKAIRQAKVVQACKTIELMTRAYFSGDGIPSDFTLRDGYGGARTNHPVVGDDAEQLSTQLHEYLLALTGKLPRGAAEVFDKVAAMDEATLDAINACGTAFSLSLTEGHKGLTAKVLDSIGFDASQHITMTADNYFSRVPKALILDALKDAGCDSGREELEKSKKAALAAEAEKRVAGTGWLPKLIRTPAAKKAKAAAAKPEKTPAKKKPATVKKAKASKR